MKSFPKPLSTKEEQLYLEQYKAGNMEARDVLIERNLRLVAHIAKKYSSNDREMEDYISIGIIGLIKGIDSFNVEKGIRLATYASRCIENELLMVLRSSKKQSKEVYLYEAIGSDSEGNSITLVDIIECEDKDIVEEMELDENIKMLRTYLETSLSKREKKIICMRYGLLGEKEVTQREIAHILGISRSYVSRIEKKALKKLKECYMKQN